MIRSALFACALALVALASDPARAEVSVTYAPARDVSNLEYRSVNERDALFRHVARLVTRMGERDLPKGRSLTVELLSIRPAGMFQPWVASASAPRVLTDVTPPSVKLRYALKERGRTIAGGEETVTDLNYLSDLAARTSIGSFPYESELMRDWFRDRIVRLKAPLR